MGARTTYLVLGSISCLAFPGSAERALAQIATDGTVGPRVQLGGPEFQIGAELGRLEGTNLFHSFEHFGLRTLADGTVESATFSGPDAIRNVIGRVTGGTRSTIDGALRSTIAGADLWLINPAGMLFGPNASLDVQGSLHLSIAEELRFADGARFSAKDLGASTFTSAPPEAFGFLGAGRAPIDFQGAVLNVPPGATFSVTGGDINVIDGAQLAAVSFDARDAGDVRVESSGTLTLSGPDAGLFANSLASEESGHAGQVVVDAKRLEMRGGALVMALTAGGGSAGTIEVAADAVVLDQARIDARSVGRGDAGRIEIEAQRIELDGNTRIFADSFGGRAGSIDIETGQLTLAGGSQISNSGWGEGTEQGGDLVIRASKGIVIVGLDRASGFRSGLFNAALGNADAGDIVITTPSLVVDGGRINTDTKGPARAGSIRLIGPAQVDIVLRNDGQVYSGTTAGGGGGDIVITRSGTLEVLDQSRIDARSFGDGDAGNISIEAQTIALDGNSRIFADSFFGGRGGTVEIKTDQLSPHRRGPDFQQRLGARARSEVAI